MYMDEFKEYSSFQVYQVAEMARAKGLTLLGNVFGGRNGSDYCVVKEIAGQTLTLKDDGTVFQDYDFDYDDEDDYEYKSVHFDLTLEQAKERIANFDGTIKNYPRFFAFARVYENEPESFGTMQQVYLDEFACRHGITYAGKFICSGGLEDEACGARNEVVVGDVIKCCEASFSDITKDDYLVVADYDRLNNEIGLWGRKYAIIFVLTENIPFEDADYERYQYKEKPQEVREYEEMCYEYQEMMSELDVPDVPAIEWDEEDEEQYEEYG